MSTPTDANQQENPQGPEYEVRILRDEDEKPIVIACKMPTPCRAESTGRLQGLKVDLVIRYVGEEVRVSGTVNEAVEE